MTCLHLLRNVHRLQALAMRPRARLGITHGLGCLAAGHLNFDTGGSFLNLSANDVPDRSSAVIRQLGEVLDD
jgi:hypothetical protein